MKNINIALFFILTFSGCAALGTKTLYKTNQKEISIHKIGIIEPRPDRIALTICPESIEIMNNTFVEGFKEFNGYELEFVSGYENMMYDNPDLAKIKNICSQKKIDGVIIPNLKFIHITYSVYYVPIAENFDTEVELKLYDKNGSLIIQTLHNTYKGNSYMMPPKTETTVRDGTYGALKRLLNELNKL